MFKLFALAILLVVLLAQAGIAFAHARFKTANILPDAIVTTVPATLTITFSEETSPEQTKLQVLDAGNKAVDKGDLKVDGPNASVSLGTLADGKYTVKFRSFTEDDGGIVNGDYSFTVAKAGTAAGGDAAKAAQQESQSPTAPATGAGGGATSPEISMFPALGLLVVLAMGASMGLLVLGKRRR